MSPEEQSGFDFDCPNDESGYQKWQESLTAQKREIETDHGLILGQKVRVQLKHMNKTIEGTMHHRLQNKKLILSIGSLEFTPDDIESMIKI